ncbi:hypothetical protein [Ramlibacter sp. PS4R-6]|uniref:hypothetical protein n=1 Tax=Ramlibacter sp. PS4R-6 TaxID=3133438 RepID=UPI0030B1098B
MLRLGAAAAVAALAACAAPLDMRPSRLVPLAATGAQPRVIELIAPAAVQPAGGRRRPIEVGSTWQSVGRIDQGEVYKRLGGVFIVQARDVHEACLVVSDGKVVGVYLPVEQTFSPVVPPVQLTLRGTP